MSECTSFKDAPAQTRAKCRIVANFENQCFSMALDPTAGQNGWGYSVDVSQAEADFEALEMCRLTSPDSRAGACIVTLRKCDGTAA